MQALTSKGGRSRRAWLAVAFVAAGLIALGAGVFVAGVRPFGDAQRGGDAGALLGITLPDTAGALQPLAQWKGKVLVVNFWATWCAPCRDEMPEFVRVQQELGPKGVQFVGIAADSADKVAQFADEIHLNYPALVGGFGAIELSRALGNTVMALPFTVVVDRNGRVAHTQLGPLRDAKLRAVLAALI